MRISDWSSDVCSSDLCGVEIYAPAAERFGIMLAEMMRIAPIEALRLCKGAEARFGQQHAARKNIRLDEIGAGCIAIEYGVIDAYILDRCPAARLQQAVNGGQIIGQICLYNGFDHPHAGEGVILD